MNRQQRRAAASQRFSPGPAHAQLTAEGLRHHQAGQLDAAATLYLKALAQQPNDARTLHLLGVLRHHQGRSPEAVELITKSIAINHTIPEAHSDLGVALESLGKFDAAASTYRQALALRPDYPEAYNNLGNALRHSGTLDEAVAALRQAIALKPNYPEAHNNLATTLHDLHRPAEAETSARQAIRLRENYPEAHNTLAAALHALGRPAEAEASSRRALRLRPNYPEAHNNLAAALHALGRLAEAETSCREAIRLRPDYPEAHNNLAGTLWALGRLAEAGQNCRQALSLRPDYPEALNNLGGILWDLGQPDEAGQNCREAIRLRPDYAEAHNNLGGAQRALGNATEAETSCRQALRLRPNFPEALNNLATALYLLGRVTEAEASCREALRLQPDYPNAHNNLAYTLLLAGRLEEGWAEYEWRWKTRHFLRGHRHFPAPLWNGDPIGDRAILLHAEQGFGDTLQFCRYVPLIAADAKNIGARIVLEVQAPLVRLLSQLPGVTHIIARDGPPPEIALPAFDLHCPLLSLPHAMGTTLDTIPGATPYLAADPVSAAHWRQRLLALPGLRVGLVWAGGQKLESPEFAATDRRRSITLDTMAPFADVTGISFVSLQKDAPSAQAANPPRGMTLHDFSAELHDFTDTAALIDGLDLVISVDTAVAHLAGALGKPVWLLNRFDTDWRWLLNRDDSPWYPRLRQFRQPCPGDWATPIGTVRDALQRLSEGDRDQLTPARHMPEIPDPPVIPASPVSWPGLARPPTTSLQPTDQ